MAVIGLLSPAVSIHAEDTRLLIMGSTTILPVAERIGRAFQSRYPDTRITVVGGGSLSGIRALVSGEADIATSSSFISEVEIDQARRQGIYPVPFRIAYDVILPIVHGSNPVTDLSRPELNRIYRGEIDNWRQLGGPDRAIEVVTRNRASGTYKVWSDVVMQQESVVTALPPKNSNGEVVRAVSVKPGAIGYIGLSHLNARVKPLSVDGVMGSTHSLKRGDYPLSRPLFMFTDGWPRGKTLEFINFVLDSSNGQAMIAAAGYIPLN